MMWLIVPQILINKWWCSSSLITYKPKFDLLDNMAFVILRLDQRVKVPPRPAPTLKVRVSDSHDGRVSAKVLTLWPNPLALTKKKI